MDNVPLMEQSGAPSVKVQATGRHGGGNPKIYHHTERGSMIVQPSCSASV